MIALAWILLAIYAILGVYVSYREFRNLHEIEQKIDHLDLQLKMLNHRIQNLLIKGKYL